VSISSTFYARFFANILVPKITKLKCWALQFCFSFVFFCAKISYEKLARKALMKLATSVLLYLFKTTVNSPRNEAKVGANPTIIFFVLVKTYLSVYRNPALHLNCKYCVSHSTTFCSFYV